MSEPVELSGPMFILAEWEVFTSEEMEKIWDTLDELPLIHIVTENPREEK